MTRVFVYGSLLSGLGNHRVIAHAPFLGTARTLRRYTLVSLGAFPGLLEGGHTAIHGELYAVNDETLAVLDRFEGHPGFYVRMPIALARRRPAHAYLLPASRAKRCPAIESGDWRQFRSGSSRYQSGT
jgi:gamma-glutamylcyclotransferase (GGCT)/AIG2-like uncharacterized protein YtfP